ncbi:MAG: MarR family transcriptional regulator [Bacillales bacterium]|nr:MarR family transcriptional regulator [Bacillales bacterium]
MKRNNQLNELLVAGVEKDLRFIDGIIREKGREILKDFGITPPQFIALQWLNEEGDMTIGDLSTKMFLAFSTTTDLIDRMEKNCLVSRVRDPQDRRVVQVHLLEEGRRIINEVISRRQNYLSNLISTFEVNEVTELQRLLSKLHKEMKTESSGN